MITRRTILMALLQAGKPLIDTHVHLFDPERFPYHPKATYKPPAEPVEKYLAFAKEAGLTGAVIVHPEPYQDDHAYLEYCLGKWTGFKGTCLFDPIARETPARMADLVNKHPGRIVALRIHENRTAGVPPTAIGTAIRDRDLKHPAVKTTWRKAHDLGLAIQMHLIPLHAPEIAALAREFSSTPVVLDHFARAGQGTPEQYNNVLAMAKLPNVYMKFSGLSYIGTDKKSLVRRTYDAFGPDRMLWGGLGITMESFHRNQAEFNQLLDFATDPDKAKIRGLTAAKLYKFSGAGPQPAAGSQPAQRITA